MSELGDFLRTRRGQLDRADVGLPMLARGRLTGLRREEVAFLSGVSITWYTWLEQGRDINPSRQVLDAVARTLQLSDAEHAYVLALAGYSGVRVETATSARAPDHIGRLLDSMADSPAFAIEPDWTISAWNRAYAALYPNIARVPDTDRNLLFLVFTDPYVRELLPNWDIDSRRFLAEFRAEAGPRVSEPSFVASIARLREASPEFRHWWPQHDIEGFTTRERLFHHPLVGDIRLEHHRLAPSDHPDLHLVIYTPVPATDAADRLRRLLDAEDTQ